MKFLGFPRNGSFTGTLCTDMRRRRLTPADEAEAVQRDCWPKAPGQTLLPGSGGAVPGVLEPRAWQHQPSLRREAAVLQAGGWVS